ncbi:hypothetical protein A3Q56_08341, partial [Intoshia linei]
MRQINIQKRELLVTYFNRGYTQVKIARELFVSRRAVQEIIKKHQK